MNCRNRFATLLTAAVIGAVAIASAPRLFGGGGDEGVDILPFQDRGGAAGDGGVGAGGVPRPMVGYLTMIPVNGLVVDDKADWRNAGVLFGPHRISDVFVGHLGEEPWHNMTSVEIVAKGKKHLSCAKSLGLVHVEGRYEMTDLDPTDRENLTLVGRWYTPAVVTVLVGVRSTHKDSIPASFSRIDRTDTSVAPTGMVDLKAFRATTVANLAGSGLDVAIGLTTVIGTQIVSSWAAFNVDDAAALYDIDAK